MMIPIQYNKEKVYQNTISLHYSYFNIMPKTVVLQDLYTIEGTFTKQISVPQKPVQ